MLGFYVPPTAKVIWRRDLGLKSHPKDCFIMLTHQKYTVIFKAVKMTSFQMKNGDSFLIFSVYTLRQS